MKEACDNAVTSIGILIGLGASIVNGRMEDELHAISETLLDILNTTDSRIIYNQAIVVWFTKQVCDNAVTSIGILIGLGASIVNRRMEDELPAISETLLDILNTTDSRIIYNHAIVVWFTKQVCDNAVTSIGILIGLGASIVNGRMEDELPAISETLLEKLKTSDSRIIYNHAIVIWFTKQVCDNAVTSIGILIGLGASIVNGRMEDELPAISETLLDILNTTDSRIIYNHAIVVWFTKQVCDNAVTSIGILIGLGASIVNRRMEDELPAISETLLDILNTTDSRIIYNHAIVVWFTKQVCDNAVTSIGILIGLGASIVNRRMEDELPAISETLLDILNTTDSRIIYNHAIVVWFTKQVCDNAVTSIGILIGLGASIVNRRMEDELPAISETLLDILNTCDSRIIYNHAIVVWFTMQVYEL